jgi:uncharacterized protein YndB with AHSA1/START domain
MAAMSNDGPMGMSHAQILERETVITRIVRAKREKVWELLTNPEHLAHWWGPEGFRTTTHSMDFRAGGQWRYTMHGPDGRDYVNIVTYLAITPNERLEFRHAGEGETTDACHQTLITLEPVGTNGEHTKVTLRGIFDSRAAMEHVIKTYGALEGGKQTLARLDEYALQRELDPDVLTISRVLRAPRELVWKVWTTREHLVAWLGSPEFVVSDATLDLRVGGAFQFCMRAGDGAQRWVRWTYREIVPNERLSVDVSFVDAQGQPVPNGPPAARSTVTFVDHAGIDRGTLVTIRRSPIDLRPESLAQYRAFLPMIEMGWKANFDRMASVLAR